MTRTFQHTFAPGETLTLTVDLDHIPPTFVAYPMGLASRYPDQYKIWLQEVVSPTIESVIDKKMQEWFAEYGGENMI